MCFGESTLEAMHRLHTRSRVRAKQKMNGHVRDWERSTARDESGARSHWLRGVIPDQNMFAQDDTRNLKHGGCGGSEFRCALMAASDRKETSNRLADYWEGWHNVCYVSYESSRKLNARAKR